MKSLSFIVDDEAFEVKDLLFDKIIINRREYEYKIHCVSNGKNVYQLIVDDRLFDFFVKANSDTQYDIWINQDILTVTVQDLRAQIIFHLNELIPRGTHPSYCTAPMPGLVTTINVHPGDLVEPGKPLLILEAMKMENEIRAAIRGRVKSVEVKNRTSVEKDQILMIIEPIHNKEND
ncbi:MAG: hypothetical protein HYR76_09485 [Ignavibacteria bacterium]|nr:hypothetical protein [Ignavibacteria bacterium]